MNQFLDQFFLLKKEPGTDWPPGKTWGYFFYRILVLCIMGMLLGIALLGLAAGPYSDGTLLEYLSHPETLLLNTLPVILLILLLYAVFGRAWIAYLLGGGICFGLSLANYYKLIFRDDPLYFEDLLILREAKNMVSGNQYGLFLDGRILTAALCLIMGAILLFFLVRGKAHGWKRRLSAALVSLGAWAVVVPLCLNPAIYQTVEAYHHLNSWSSTQNYVGHGFLYPFIHSVSSYIETPPEGYSQAKAEALLSSYEDADIPPERQVHLITIMREAYADFSQYGIEGLDESCYTLYHALEDESYTGDLVTNIFAGGTIRTEQSFLTGSYQFKNYRGNTNSYLWYLKQQGYTVEGSHPFYQWFYNRKNVNSYLGFDRYRFLEGDFEYFTDSYYPEDSVLYPEVYADYLAGRSDGKPYFSFSVTVQSHGPYDTEDYKGDTEYLTGPYSQACKNAMNNYLSTIMDGDAALIKLVDQLRSDPEPVVLVTFSDHLPWMGDGGRFYDEMEIDIDPSTEEGFRRHYTTRYLIWANDAAKEVLGHDVHGEGPDISPCYLMNLVFRQLGWHGPAFLQAMDDMMEVFPVAGTAGRSVVDGVMTDTIPEDRQALYQDFLYLQQYWKNEFLYFE